MKKIISLLLSVMMILSSFSVVMADDAVASEVVEEEVVVTEDFKLMQTLGIFDDMILPDAPITRRQLAEIYVNIILPEQGDEEYIATKMYFDDIIESDFDVNMVYEMGIMGGSGDNKFLPDNYVTYAQFVKTVVDFLGYKMKAESYGGYPIGYQIMGIDFGFSKFAPSDMNMLCTTNMAAAIFREALGVKLNHIIYTAADGGPVFTDNDINYLEAYRGVYAAEGIITSTYVGDLLKNSKTDFFDIKVDEELYVLSDDTLYLNGLLGNRIRYFYSVDANDNKEIIFAEIIDTDIVEIYPDQFDNEKTTTSTIYYYDDANKERKISIESADIFYNGELCASYDINDINPFAASNVDGHVRCVSVDGNAKDAEYVFVETFNTYLVSSVSNGQITNKYHPSVIFKTEDFDEKEIILKNVNGDHIKSDLIAAEDILNVFSDRNGAVRKAILTIDTHVGIIESIKRSGDTITSIKFDGLELKTSANLKTSDNYDKIKPGVRAMAIFDYLGQVTEIEIDAFDTATFYGYITDAAKTSDINNTYEVRLYTLSGFKIIPLNEEVLLTREVDSVLVEDERVTPEVVIDYLGSPVKRQICRYTTNKNGEISKLEFAVEHKATLEGKNGLFKHNIGTASFNKYSYGFGAKSTGYDAFLLSGTPVMIVPSEEDRYDDTGYVIKDRNYMYSNWHSGTPNTATEEKLKVYGMNPDSAAADFVVIEAAGSTDSYTGSYFIVSGKSAEYLNGESRYVMSGYINKNSYTYEFSEEAYYSNTAASNGEYDIGDVIYIKRDIYNVVQAVDMVFDASEWKTSEAYATNSSYYKCEPTYIDEKIISYNKPASEEGGVATKKSYIIEGAQVYVYKENGRGVKSVTVGSTADIRATNPHGYFTDMFVQDDSRVIWAYIKIDD